VPHAGPNYIRLDGAKAEMNAIKSALEPLGLTGNALLILYDEEATYRNVRNVLSGDTRKHIIHFCGHGEFNPTQPNESKLLLHKGEALVTGQIVKLFSRAKPILCFINACNSAQTPPLQPPSPEDLLDKNRYNVYGLGKAFLETGTYLLGANWEIEDEAAATFAGSFYKSLLVKGVSLGEAVRNARVECKKLNSSDFAWASYVLYGDPRVQFQMPKVSSVVRVRTNAPISASRKSVIRLT